MTENEAKGWLIELKDCEETQEFYYADCIIETLDIAIQALEEIQQYRAIATVEEFKTLKEKNEPEKPLLVPTDDTCLYQEYRCPSCNEWLADKFKPYRCKCGQKLDWQ